MRGFFRLFLPFPVFINNIADDDYHQCHDDNIQLLAVSTDEGPIAAEAIAEVGEESVPERGTDYRVE